MLGVIFKVGSEWIWRLLDTLDDRRYIIYTLGMSYSSSSKAFYTCRSTNSTAFETSERTRGLSATDRYPHRCGPFEKCQTLTNMLLSRKKIDNETNGHREADRVITHSTMNMWAQPRLWREVE